MMDGFEILRDDEEHNRGQDDVPNVIGNTNNENVGIFTEMRTTASNEHSFSIYEQWNRNYHEAAIFLEEGKNNEKFTSHPKSKDDLPSYIIVHQPVFYIIDMFSCLLLMSLAVVETPAVPLFKIDAGIHASLELLALFVICIQLAIRIRWLGIMQLLQHKRTVLKILFLAIMLIEAIIVIVRQKNHFRVTRSFRPMFLIDNHYCGGVRRFIRQMLQSLPPIIDMLILILFFMLIFATLGFYLFSTNENDPYFSSLKESFVSLFILLTTANFPDVMMPAYNANRASAIYFIIYLVINLYFLMNLMLAVVYEKFTKIEKQKFRKLLLHRRRACQHSFRLLVSKRNPNFITFKHFEGLMKYHRPKSSKRDIYLTFKTLDTNCNGYINLEEFYQVYEVCSLKWRPKRVESPWYEGFWKPVRMTFSLFRQIVTWKYFDYLMNVVILCQGVWQVLDAAMLSYSVSSPNHKISNLISIVFVSVYCIEGLLKLGGLGFYTYLSNGWNKYDLLITILSIFGLVMEFIDASPIFFIVVLRPLRLLRLFKIKKRYRDVFGTVFILLPRLFSAAVVLLIVYYFFAIIGMEFFSRYNMMNCCQNTSVAAEFQNISGKQGYYYLNNFNDIFTAGITLFELTVVNNWFIIMNGYAAVSSQWSRVYFMSFYLITMIVLQVIVAFIIEAFLFRIQYKKKMGDMDKDTLVKVDIGLTREEIDFCYSKSCSISELSSYSQALDATFENDQLTYCGVRTRTKNSFYMKMYADEVKEWLLIAEEEEKKRLEALQRLLRNNDQSSSRVLPIDDIYDISRRTRSI